MLVTSIDSRKVQLFELYKDFKFPDGKVRLISDDPNILDQLVYVCDYDKYTNDAIDEFLNDYKIVVINRKITYYLT